MFDLGQSNLYIENARKLNIDLEEIDILIISHGHFDHGGALKSFLNINKKAKIYIHKNAFDKHYFKFLFFNINIGLNDSLKVNERFVFVDSFLKIDEELLIFSAVMGRKYWSFANKRLFKKSADKIINDDFDHEINLIINCAGKTLLISGCCHNGIINTLDKAKEINITPNYIISGFHFLNLNLNKEVNYKLVKDIAIKLSELPIVIYTCHCTGFKAYKLMKDTLQDKLHYLSCGASFNL